MEKLNKKENSILSNKSNTINLSYSRLNDSYNQKLGYVKINIEKQYKV